MTMALWRGDDELRDARETARLAKQAIDQHIDECTRRYDAMRRETEKGFEALRQDTRHRHQENIARMNDQDKQLSRIFWAMLTGLATLVVLAIEAFMHTHTLL